MPSYAQNVPDDVRRRLRRDRLFEILAGMGAGMGTGQLGSHMLSAVAGANRNYEGGISSFLDEQFRREQETRYAERERRIQEAQDEEARMRQEARASEDQALEALAKRLGSLSYGDPTAEAQAEAALAARDAPGMSRLLGQLEERRRLQELGIDPDDPASKQRYLIEQGVDAAPRAEKTFEEKLAERIAEEEALRARGLGRYEPPAPKEPKEDPLLVASRSAVAGMVARGEIGAEAAADRVAEVYQALSRGQSMATGETPRGIPGGWASLGETVAAPDAPGGAPISGVQRRTIRPAPVGAQAPGVGGGREPILASVLARYPQAETEYDIDEMRKAGYTDADIARLLEQYYGASD